VSLHHGDCLELMPKLPDRSVDVILADLPFGITDLAWDRRLDLDALWLEYRRLLRERGAVLLFATQPFATDLINAARKWFRYEWIWLKPRPNGFLNAHKMPMRAHEQVLVFYPRLPHYRPPGLVRCHHPKRGNVGGKGVYGSHHGPHITRITGWPSTVRRERDQAFNAQREPCEKPIELLRFFIRCYTRPGAVVLDNVMGLGSTGLAALGCGRQFIGMELDRSRYQRARRRIAQALMSGVAPPSTLPVAKGRKVLTRG